MFCCDDKSMNEEEAKVYALGHIWGKEGPIKKSRQGQSYNTRTLGIGMRTTNYITVGIQERQSI
jgi:hypothetical protein